MSNRKKTKTQRLQQLQKNNKSWPGEKARIELLRLEEKRLSAEMDAILQKG